MCHTFLFVMLCVRQRKNFQNRSRFGQVIAIVLQHAHFFMEQFVKCHKSGKNHTGNVCFSTRLKSGAETHLHCEIPGMEFYRQTARNFTPCKLCAWLETNVQNKHLSVGIVYRRFRLPCTKRRQLYIQLEHLPLYSFGSGSASLRTLWSKKNEYNRGSNTRKQTHDSALTKHARCTIDNTTFTVLIHTVI
jgi:hypothetical protein